MRHKGVILHPKMQSYTSMTLKELQILQKARVLRVGGEKALRQHFLDMGIIPGTEMVLQKYAPMGDPMQFTLHGYALTLRKADAEKITVELIEATSPEPLPVQDLKQEEHPRLGESHDYGPQQQGHTYDAKGEAETGVSQVRSDEQEGAKLTFALAGNPNTGKTTLFNQLTGANQHVGNFPGVTVDKKSGSLRGRPHTTITDLPGIYSLSPYTGEEIVSRQFILNERPHCIINIVDTTTLERNLNLTLQLMELNIPMVLALNMMDELKSNHGVIKVNRMERLLGIPVVPISASKNQGVDELMEHALHVAHYNEKPARTDFCTPEADGGAVHRSLHAIMHLIEDHAQRAGLPVRFAASKLAEGDGLVAEALRLSANEQETIEHLLLQMEEERGLDRAAAMADMRFRFIRHLAQECVVKPRESHELRRSMQADRFLTGRWTAIPLFSLIMGLVFWLTFDLIGGSLQELLEKGVEAFTLFSDKILTQWQVDDTLHSLLIGGIYAGVGAIVSFVPIIVTLFLFLSLLEDSGYMARIAFVMDKLLRKLGLSGRSIVPLLIGFGCSVPSIMASRTLPSERDRRITILLTPFMSCTAKLPVYAFFCTAFFPDHGAFVMVGLYALSIGVGILFALLRKHFAHPGEAVPFVMELPNYRMPSLKTVSILLWEKSWDFLCRAFTVIFLASIAIWFLQNYNWHLQLVSQAHDSILASVAGLISPLFSPLGFASWENTTALVAGFFAKESVVSTLSVLYGSAASLSTFMNTASALSMLVFSLLYTPCVAAIAAVRRELGGRYALRVVFHQCLIAWVAAFVTYRIALLFL